MRDQKTEGRSCNKRRLLLVVSLAFVIRMMVVLLVYRSLPASVDHNEFGWEQGWIARSIAMGHGFSSPFQRLDDAPTALVAPLYPYLLGGIFRIFGLYSNVSALVALGLNALISASVVVPIHAIAMRIAESGSHPHKIAEERTWERRIPWVAATLWALYPYSIFFSGKYLWDHTITGALFAWTFLIAFRLHEFRMPGWALWGLLYGVTALSNPSILSLFPVLILIAVLGRRMPLRRSLLRVCATSATLMLVLLPWTIRNIRVMHAVVPIRDGYWGEFYAGNNDDTSQTNPAWTHPASNPVELQRYERLGEIAYMAEKRDLSLQHVSARPGIFTVQCARRLIRFWTGFWSFSDSYLRNQAMDLPNIPFCTLLTFLAFTGAWTLIRMRRRSAMAFLALLLIFPVPYYLTHASVDYREPIEPELVVLVAVGSVDLYRHWHARRALRQFLEKAVLVAG